MSRAATDPAAAQGDLGVVGAIAPRAAPPIAFTGTLADLLPLLTRELAGADVGDWCYRQLGRGALVAVKRDDSGRRTLRIARAERPETPEQLHKWGAEVETFLRHFGVERWQAVAMDSKTGIAAGFLELWPEESSVGKALCGRCECEVPYDPIWGQRQLCERCARLAGDEDTAAVHARLRAARAAAGEPPGR